MKTAAALGLFDGVHCGHRRVLSECAGYAGQNGMQAAVFTFDTATLNTKGEDFAPIYSDEVKKSLISREGIADCRSYAFSQVRELSPEEFIERIIIKELDAAAVFCGRDFTFGRKAAGNAAVLRELCSSYGIEAHIVDDVSVKGRKISSGSIRKYLREGNIITANALLGESYRIMGEVVTGNRLGRKMGCPTANILFPEGVLLPRFGVYAAKCDIDGVTYTGAANIGVKPTVGTERPLCEVHFLGFDGDLYGKILEVEFLDFIRPEQKFTDIDELFKQIAEDQKFIRTKYN